MSAGATGAPPAWAGAGGGIRIVAVLNRLLPGGVASRYATLLAEAVRRGHRCLVIAADGPERAAFAAAGCELVTPPTWDGATHAAAAAAVARADHTLWVLAPDTVPALPVLARARRVVVGAHGRADLLASWLGPAPVAIAAAALAAHPDAAVVVPGRDVVPGVAALLGIGEDRVHALPHAVVRDPTAGEGPPRPVVRDIVLCATRLTQEQRPLTRAAATLAAARGAPLVVVGTGPDREAHRALAAACRPAGVVVEDVAVRPWMRRASVLVGRGLVVLEALAEGCRAVCIDAAGEGVPVRAVSAGDWRRLAADNFSAREPAPAPAAVWRRLHRQTPAMRAELAATVLAQAGPGPALDALLGLGADAGSAGARDAEAEALGVLLSRLGAANAEASEWLARLEEARDHHRDQAAAFERLLREAG